MVHIEGGTPLRIQAAVITSDDVTTSKSKGRAILTIEVDRFYPFVLPINRGFHHRMYSSVASDNEVLPLL